MGLRRVLFVAAVACVMLLDSAVTSVLAADGSAAVDGNGKAKASTCELTLKDANAPALEPLSKFFDSKLLQTILAFITDTPFGKVLAVPEASNCIANMNGTMLGETIQNGLKQPICQPLLNMTDVPFLKIGLTSLASSTPMSVNDVLKFMKAIPDTEVKQFCGLYMNGIMPCIMTQLLPSLVVIRAQHSSGCCDDWVDVVVKNYGYSISGQITKMAQLFGDLMCSEQLAFNGEGSQTCGYTMMQSLISKPDEASTAATLLANLQVPTDQMCLRAEGKTYKNINGLTVAEAKGPTPSGCVTAFDRIATWIYGLPATKRSELFDIRALLEDEKCLKGSELFGVIKYIFPELAMDVLEVYFSKSCVHLPMKFSAGCKFTRPATLVEWASEPIPVKQTQEDGATGDAAEANSVPTTTTPVPGPSTSAARSTHGVISAAAVLITVVVGALM